MMQLPPGFDSNLFVSDIYSFVGYIIPVFVVLVAGRAVIGLVKKA